MSPSCFSNDLGRSELDEKNKTRFRTTKREGLFKKLPGNSIGACCFITWNNSLQWRTLDIPTIFCTGTQSQSCSAVGKRQNTRLHLISRLASCLPRSQPLRL